MYVYVARSNHCVRNSSRPLINSLIRPITSRDHAPVQSRASRRPLHMIPPL